MNFQDIESQYKQVFGGEEARIFFAPGRINLIGEHTDYNGGNVFPATITYGTYAIASKRSDRQVRLYSMNFEDKGIISFSLDELDYVEDHEWANYPKGMIRYLQESGHNLSGGVDVLYYGNIPNGAGLSSSASIEMVTGVLLEGLFNLDINRVDMVKIGQQVENQFIGVNSGIMDQFAIGMGKKGSGILLDCHTLEYEYAPLELENEKVIIMNTNKRRELSSSKYNERRQECDEAVQQLQEQLEIQTLGELTEEQFEQHKHLIQNETVRKRAKHAVYENQRTLNALQALRDKDLNRFGKLMNESHLSLQHDYEVTGQELDTLVEAAWDQKGVIGARMTGAGFGGCAIAIVEADKVSSFIDGVGNVYQDKIGYEASFYVASIGDGAREIESEEVVV
ncbi:galactokinase [Pontibacillus chungwhensis BH030062]|uniref:Galactokinase n=1 Tax=Pontibacillus chungwhensis BH030062 TaxID=1385513 RepID=A0A0A2UUS0_9BACI|nr:galactokinase [Pontibacillus chungwhensis]KGP90236.1 galactokinase [Pontibacillus chungwhensis BH030062]